MYKNCIFDLYGTLVDIHTNEKKEELWEKLAMLYRYYGADYETEELRTMYAILVKGKQKKAAEFKHMTMYEAAKIAKEVGAPKLWLTHYSPSMTRPEEFMDDVRKIFPAAYAAKDGWTMELNFDEGK